jgi:uncharacterized SAM-binding protein YcdF (DUF218 family)
MYAIAKALALPPGSTILLLALGVIAILLGRRRAGVALVAIGLAALYAFSIPAFSSLLARAIQQVPPVTAEAIINSDAQAIVVLSAGYTRAGLDYGVRTLDGLTLQRVRFAARIYRMHQLPILVSGGRTVYLPTPPLAELMRGALEQEFNVPVRWVENQSRDTMENAEFSSQILQSADVQRIILVTHAMHMPRAMAKFQARGLQVLPAPTDFAARDGVESADFIPRLSSLEESYYAIYEFLGYWWDVWLSRGSP